MRYLRQRGLPRTGTTLIRRLVKRAFGVEIDNGKRIGRTGAKHLQVDPDGKWPNDTLVVVNTKDPYAWLVSMHAWKIQANASGRQIPERKLPVRFTMSEAVTLLKRYNSMYRSWFDMRFDGLIVRYEDLLEDVEVLIAPLERLTGEKRLQRVTLPKGIVRPAGTKHISTTATPNIQFNKDYYTERRYLHLLTPVLIQAVTQTIDWKLFKDLYEPHGTSC